MNISLLLVQLKQVALRIFPMNECKYSMSSFKLLMTHTYLMKRVFIAFGVTKNRTLISTIFKNLLCLQRKMQENYRIINEFCCKK